MDTDVTTTQMTLMGVLMVAGAILTAGTMLLVIFRRRKADKTESKFHGET